MASAVNSAAGVAELIESRRKRNTVDWEALRAIAAQVQAALVRENLEPHEEHACVVLLNHLFFKKEARPGSIDGLVVIRNGI